MEQSLANVTQVAFGPELLEQLARETRESAASLRTAFQRAVPVAVQALAGRVSGPDGPDAIWKLSREAYGANVLEPMAAANHESWARRGESLMRGLLGETYHFTALRLATAAGLGQAAAERVLSAAAVATLGVIGEHSQEQHLSPPTLAAWLTLEGSILHETMPADTGPPAPGPTNLAPLANSPAPTVAGTWADTGGGQTYTPAVAPVAAARPSVRWQWGALLLVAVLLGYLFGNRSGSLFGRDGVAPASTATPVISAAAANANTAAMGGRYDAASGNYIHDTGQPIILRLADGTTQKVGANSTENRLYIFLADPAQQVDSVNRTKGWINFDRVYFEPGATTLTDESYLQLRNVASILKTFPAAVVKLGGYTDSTGNPLRNFQLSEMRAQTAMLAMAGMGIDMSRIQAKGYGGKHFITPNTTPEGRALNRRISIRVLKK